MSLLNLFAFLFILFIVVDCYEYGLELELLTIALTNPAPVESLQYELEVEKRQVNNAQVLGSVLMLAVQGRSELVFPEVAGKNPFHINRMESNDNVCFRLKQTFDTVGEDCRLVKDYPNIYYWSEIHNITLTDGSNLIYKLSQYLLKDDDFSVFSVQNLRLISTSTIISSPVCDKCTIPIVFACLEGGILIILIITALFYYIFVIRKSDKSSSTKSNKKKPSITDPIPNRSRPDSAIGTTATDATIYADSGVSSSASSHVDHSPNVDIRPQDAYSDCANSEINGPSSHSTIQNNMKTVPNKLKASTLSVSSAVNTLKSTGQVIKEKFNTKPRPKQDPLPLPRDYPHDKLPANQFDDDQVEDEDGFYEDIGLEDVDETTNSHVPKVPAYRPAKSFLHTGVVPVPASDASDARNKAAKFSYVH